MRPQEGDNSIGGVGEVEEERKRLLPTNREINRLKRLAEEQSLITWNVHYSLSVTTLSSLWEDRSWLGNQVKKQNYLVVQRRYVEIYFSRDGCYC